MNQRIELSFVGSRASWTSRAIELFSAGPVCHVDAVEPTSGLLWGARFDKVGGKPRGFWGRDPRYIKKETTHVVVSIPCTDGQLQRFWKATRAAQGTPYDWEGIFAFANGSDWHKRGTLFCSEAQRDHLVVAGIFPKTYFSHGNKTTPVTLLDSITARNDTVILERKGC